MSHSLRSDSSNHADDSRFPGSKRRGSKGTGRKRRRKSNRSRSARFERLEDRIALAGDRVLVYNLIQNPGGEGWVTNDNDTPWVRRLGNARSAMANDRIGSDGIRIFYGGTTGTSYLYQEQDLPVTTHRLIDEGLAYADLSGYLGGYANQNDYADVTVYWFDQWGNQLSGAVTITGPNAAARGNQTKLVYRSDMGNYLPPFARSARIEMGFYRSAGDNNSGYADRLSLKLWEKNVAPTVNIFSSSPSPYTVAEGGSIPLTMNVNDRNGGTFTYAWDTDNDGSYDDFSTRQITFSAEGLDGKTNATQTIRGRVSDGYNYGYASVTVKIANVAPTISKVTFGNPVAEGTATTIVVTASDPGLDPLTYYYDLNDDGIYESSNTTGTIQYSFPDNGSYQFRVRVRDKDNAYSDVVTKSVDVYNISPTINRVTNSGPVQENTPVTIEVTASDPAGANDPLTYKYDFDNDGEYEYESTDSSATHIFPDNGTFKVNVLVEDGDGGSRTSFTDVTVQNVAPVITSIENTGPIPQGTPFVITVAASDQAGSNDPLTYLFDLDGDGEFESSNATGRIGHVLFDAGTHRIGVGVRDDDTGLTTSYTDVQVLSITPPDDLPGDAPRVSFDTGYRSVREETITLPITARLNKVSEVDVVIPLSIGGSATKLDDFDLATSITIPAGELSSTIPLTIMDDNQAETSEGIVIRMLPPTNAVLSSHPADPIVQTILVQANDAPSVSFSAAHREISESGGQLTIKALLSNASEHTVVAPFSVTGTATIGVDYGLAASSFVFQPGELESVIVLDVIDDTPALSEPSEQMVLRLSDPRVQFADGSTAPVLLGSISSTVVTILDDDQIKVSIDARSSVYEDENEVVVTTRLSLPSAEDTIVSLSALNSPAKLGSDFSFPNGTIGETFFIPAGFTSWSTIIRILDDEVNEPTEAMYLTANATGATSSVYPTRIDILDDDPIVSLVDASVQLIDSCGVNWCVEVPFGEGGSRDVTLKVALSQPTNIDVNVPILLTGTATSGEDYQVLNDMFVVIPAGQTEKSVRLRILDDLLDEPLETLVATLGVATNATRSADKSRVTYEIQDNDQAYLSFAGLSQTVSELDGVANVTVRLSMPSAEDVAFSFERIVTSTADGRDYAFPAAENMIIPAGALSHTVAVTIKNDDDVETAESLNLRLKSEDASLLIGQTNYTITILSEDKKPETTNRSPGGPYNAIICSVCDGEGTATRSKPGSTSSGSGSGSGTGSGPLGGLIIFDYSGQSSLLAGGTLFLDANKNLVLDPGEYKVTTALDGYAEVALPIEFDTNDNGTIDVSEGQWVLSGSIDPATGLALSGSFTAPAGSYVVSPLTTLMNELVESQVATGQIADVAAASQRVTDALGLPSIPLMQFDATYETYSGNVEAAAIYAAQAMVYDTVKQVAALAAGLPGAPPRAALEAVVFADLAGKIREPGSALDLRNPFVLRSVLDGTLTATGVVASEALLDGAAEVIAAGNQQLASIPLAGDRSYLEAISKVKKLAQGEIATQLLLASVGQQEMATVVSMSTGSELERRIAETEIGNVVAPELWIGDSRVVEGDSGESWVEFEVALVNESVVPVSVQYSTIDGNATVDSGDYSPLSGTLTWNPGDQSVQTLRVPVTPDAAFESDEYFLMLLEEPQNAVIRRHLGTAVIENDDALSFSAPADGNDHDFTIELLDKNVIIGRGGEILLAATVSTAPITLIGAEGMVNRFRLVIGSDSQLPSGGLTLVGDGDDIIEIHQPALVEEIAYNITGTTTGSVAIDGSLLTFSGIADIRDNITTYHRSYQFSSGAAQDMVLGESPDLDSKLSRLTSEEDGKSMTFDFASPWESLTIQTGAGADSVDLQALDESFNAALILETGEGDDEITLHATTGGGGYSIDGGAGNDAFHHLGGELTAGLNVAATVFGGGDDEKHEGEFFLRGGLFTDPGNDTWTATVDYGDGTGVQSLALSADKMFTLNHAFADNGVYTVTITVVDDKGDIDTDSFQVTITNVAPRVDLNGSSLNVRGDGSVVPFSAVRGQQFHLAAGIADPGFDNPERNSVETFSYIIQWGDGAEESGDVTIDRAGSSGLDTLGSLLGTHVYTQDGTYLLALTVVDDDGGTTIVHQEVTIDAYSLQTDNAQVIGGTTGSDTVSLQPSGSAGQIVATLNGTALAPFSGVSRIVVFGQDGNDDLHATGSLSVPVWLYGDAGNDRLKGGAANDVLIGGDGDDVLAGASGRDLLIGGLGADRIVGNADDDIMVAGGTTFDANEHGLMKIMAEWTSQRNYEVRIANLNGTATGAAFESRANEGYFLITGSATQAGTLLTDDSEDVLTGSSGLDWFLFTLDQDRATDLKDEAFADIIDWIES